MDFYKIKLFNSFHTPISLICPGAGKKQELSPFCQTFQSPLSQISPFNSRYKEIQAALILVQFMKLSMFCESTVCLEGVPVPTHAAQERKQREYSYGWDMKEIVLVCQQTVKHLLITMNSSLETCRSGVLYIQFKDSFIVNLSTFSGNG